MRYRTWILAGFILVKFVLSYWLVLPEYDLQRDEYLHLDQANHPAWGYLSVPPVTSWISMIIRLLGNTVFWVKFFPALFGGLTMVLVWKAVEELKGDLFALVLGATCVLFSVLLRLNILFQPNSLDVLSWTAFYYVILKFINTDNRKWLFAGAVVLAFGFLNKYNIVFQLLGILPAILLTPQRKWFVSRHLYMAGLLALLLVFPNLWWQYQNGFPVVHHMSELAEKHLVNVDPVNFMKAQLFFFAGSIFVIFVGLAALFFFRSFRSYRLFGWSFCFTLVLFLVFKAKDYYAIGLYPVYLAFGSVAFSEFTKSGWRRTLRPVAVSLPLLFFIPMYHFVFPNKTPEHIVTNSEGYRDLGLLRWEDGKDHHLPQDFADMLGWKELAQKVDIAYAAMPNPDETLVLCDNYGQAGAINYYTTQGIKAVSFNADYVNWFELDKPYRHLIRVKNRRERDEEYAQTSPFFENAMIADSIVNPYAREFGTTIFSFSGARININERIREEVSDARSSWK